jgi:predicted DNA-binding transcriptional regulator AlpA
MPAILKSTKRPAAQVAMAKKAEKIAAANKVDKKAKRPANFGHQQAELRTKNRELSDHGHGDHGSNDDDGDAGDRLLSRPEVLDIIGVSYPTLWLWMRQGRFPRSRSLGGKVAWLKSEIAAWMHSLPRTELKTLSGEEIGEQQLSKQELPS